MAPQRTTDQKVRDWFEVYQSIRDELTPAATRELLKLIHAGTPADQLGAGLNLARAVMANDRAAALAAAMLTQGGVSRPIITGDGDVGG